MQIIANHSKVLGMTCVFAALVSLSSLLYSSSATSIHTGQRLLPLLGHWRVTDSETLWTDRYNNDDYGYLVLLGPGVVAHATHPPSPNHGFFIALPDVGKTTFTLYKTEKRYMWVDASYDTSDDQSLANAANNVQSTQGSTKPSDSVKHIATKIVGVPAIDTVVENSTPDGIVIDESIVAVRCGIVYTIALHTTRMERSGDERRFRTLLDGFRWLKLSKKECSNP